MSAGLPGPAASQAWGPDLKAAAVWGLLAGLSTVAVVPYLSELGLMQPGAQAYGHLQVPLPAFVALQGVQALLLLGIVSLLGLRMGHRVGLGSPLLQAWLARRPAPAWRMLKPRQAVALGVLAAAAVLGMSLVLDPLLPAPVRPVADPGAGHSALNGLLGSFYGGIVEELELRLFLMTLLVWRSAGVGHRPRPSGWLSSSPRCCSARATCQRRPRSGAWTGSSWSAPSF